jgi:pimeloyl-ACP methyl ester carboxylesterase
LSAAREDVGIPSAGETLGAWLYRPHATGGDVPCIVMGHGFGATKDSGLAPYADRFAAAGYAALVFDYRHFGDSTGEPRHLVDVRRQHADWHAAIAHARGLEGVDPARVAIWGSSFGGGHVIAVAAGEPELAAAVAQVPHTSGTAALRVMNPRSAATVTALGIADQAAALVGRGPVYARIIGPPGSRSMMTAPDAEPGYMALVPAGSSWHNDVAARVALRVAGYSPGKQAKNVRCPLLVQVADDDSVAPAQAAVDAANAAPRGELRRYPFGHFDVYLGDPFERAVADQLAFFANHLSPAG